MKHINSYNTPIYNYLRKYAEEQINIFHMPGHKLGKGVPHELAQDLLQLDVTEVEGTDNLHYPEGIIKQAQEQAARAFGADKTFFLVNGSTCGIQAAIMTACARGQKLIAGRDSHKSVAAGLILSGAEPVFANPEFNEEFAIPAEIKPESLENALRANPAAAAVLITRPNYYGICSDIEKISSLVHSHGKLLIVDEAHGAHLAFSDRLPPSALEYGADICIQSAHKTLPAVTQGAYLHVKGDRVDMDRLSFNLAMLQTSSPSYIIMSYLDIARELMEREGRNRLEELVEINTWFREEIEKTGVYKVLSNGNMGIKAIQDPTRLVINIRRLGISGYLAEKILREKYSTQIEMADYENLVIITTVADTRESLTKLLDALKALACTKFGQNHECKTEKLRNILKDNSNKENRSLKLLPWEAFYSEKKLLSLQKSVGRISADIITPYPPGVPLLYPGEIITDFCIQYITDIIAAGGKVNGIANGRCISVITDA
ncbi:MAG TPA: aminotransferase class I/II-fold pyridoxal phosphate-dependent enzyme [Ruminiclostridium sp.]|nr:aminotransferase class I/II-fold pyridoxal phosphate-dependent enzyme [Ruminiclostridium sp.]